MARALDGYRPPLLRIRHPLVHASPSNLIIFGEMGVGKSSLVNLIAGKLLAVASSGAISSSLPTRNPRDSFQAVTGVKSVTLVTQHLHPVTARVAVCQYYYYYYYCIVDQY
ncbi:hypothetical protein K503DRAFT_282925 [Rhizopogon vinicolor AM-OR11-026]|uniref:G domain-containing protein n=1 Tax=Rhizopogon vinicolor AM-OR11-026 TaxID=1314800 RepID=A0A1B7MVU9_9AGAM|nr:hypothetical protein K503DRAFT_282925 [Rhizopogon vinicolor AM-OR11-026]